MASFIPTLSLFILVLFNSYFTLPIVDEQLSSSTFPLLNDDLTTEHKVNVRLVPDDETTALPYMDKKGLIDEHLGFQVSTSYFNEQGENVGQAIRTFDELSTTESMTFTTESSLPDERVHYDFSFTTVEPTTYTTQSSFDYEQGHHDFLSTTIEPTIYTTESSVDYEQAHHNFLSTTIEPTTNTTESSVDYEQGHHDVSFTTIEPTTPLSHLEIQSFTSESESESESETDKREIEVEFTTSDTLSFTSTEKHTGLKSNNETEEEQEPEESTKLMKTLKKVLITKPSKIQPEDLSAEESTKLMKTLKKVLTTKPSKIQPEEQEPEESTKLMKTFKKVLTTKPSKIQLEDLSAEEPTAPTAVFDQEALNKISYIPNDFMVLDENNTIVVTDLPEKHPLTTMKYKNEQQPLTQGSTLILFLLAALLLCACVMASTLAFVKNRYNLKRKSRITEMEAHLDEHYQHYPHPFMFQQNYEKQ